jgi:Na+-transporting NADH:ubiquinone oxidoreductase subunit NqrA
MSPIHAIGWACIAVGALLIFSELCDAVVLEIAGRATGQGTHIFTVVGANMTGNCLNWTIKGGI